MRVIRLLIVLLTPLLALLLFAVPARAQSPVTDCSTDAELRADIAVSSVITFTCGVATITLDTPLVIDKYVEIDGSDVITLTGAGVTHHFTVTEAAGTLRLRNIALIDGSASISDTAAQPAGSIYNAGVLFVDHVTLQNNRADAPSGAGAIYSSGYLEITNSRVISNTGGASGAVTADYKIGIGASEFVGNQGGASGAIISRHALRLGDSTLRGNSAITGTGALSLTSGVDYYIETYIDHSTLDGNTGVGCGAIHVDMHPIILEASTISRNTSTQGNAICVGAQVYTALVLRSTISGNHSYGAALRSSASAFVYLQSATITNNVSSIAGAGGVAADAYLIGVTVVIAGNGDQNCDLYVGPELAVILSNSVVGDASCVPSGTDTTVSIADPLLSSLADNGGPTLTHMPQSGSPAINIVIGSNACTVLDQRGVPRWYGACDAGAVEVVQGTPFFLPAIQRMPSAFSQSAE